ncbi:Fe(3+) ABC transporter substrate-binding protein [Spirulina sp. 06S082]|uniref:Fe(3+) ABC transporter substrate-binding protein n=1 Tax=Spirulina sp. 06S082 TaxID=3110248 RepID=UPI002B1F082C|nr:Fe(3+) ABC transporter substrate-binding protein [Spirulina sp. 06S082]MEA5470506.1 Fe(3+) ABC transporter substrate-binding protein [Spirulina sp. 06S082]
MTAKTRTLLSLATGLSLLIAAGCSSNQPGNTEASNTESEPSQAGEINLYSARHYDSDDALYENFTKETGIKINLIEGKESDLIERIKNEGDNSPVDVFITVDVGNLWKAQEEGILQPISSDILEKNIPENLREDEGYWFGLTKRARLIVYNKDKVKAEDLSTYENLATPEWKGRICIRSSSNIYNQSLVASKIEELGEEKAEEWVKGVVNNFAREPEGNDTSQIEAVASGECDVALVNSYYVARLMRSDDAKKKEIAAKIGVFFPNQESGGTHINISGAGVTINAPHKEKAIAFIEYLTSPEAQEIFADGNNEYPVVSGVSENETVKALGNFKESELDVESYGEKNADAVKVMDRGGWK